MSGRAARTAWSRASAPCASATSRSSARALTCTPRSCCWPSCARPCCTSPAGPGCSSASRRWSSPSYWWRASTTSSTTAGSGRPAHQQCADAERLPLLRLCAGAPAVDELHRQAVAAGLGYGVCLPRRAAHGDGREPEDRLARVARSRSRTAAPWVPAAPASPGWSAARSGRSPTPRSRCRLRNSRTASSSPASRWRAGPSSSTSPTSPTCPAIRWCTPTSRWWRGANSRTTSWRSPSGSTSRCLLGGPVRRAERPGAVRPAQLLLRHGRGRPPRGRVRLLRPPDPRWRVHRVALRRRPDGHETRSGRTVREPGAAPVGRARAVRRRGQWAGPPSSRSWRPPATTASSARLLFIFGARSTRDLYCLEESETLAGSWDADYTFVPVLSEESADSVWTGARGMVTDVIAGLLAELLASCDAYVCGPPAMVDAVEEQPRALRPGAASSTPTGSWTRRPSGRGERSGRQPLRRLCQLLDPFAFQGR